MKSKEPLLPKGIEASDLEYPQYPQTKKFNSKQYQLWHDKPENHVVDRFEMWFTPGFGWCVPTLLIRHSSGRRARGFADRTYAAAVENGQVVSIGLGPHVTKQVTVYVRASRKDALQKFLDLRTKGQADAGMIRDRISTRRAQTAMRRSDLFRGLF